MLRYGFLPSDFHPQFLILGERDDIEALVRILRRFAGKPERIDIQGSGAEDGARGARLALVPSDSTAGLRQAETPGNFAWELDAAGAETFADMIDEMLAAREPAGSTILEVPGLEVAGSPNIPVKVSYGEFTEEFLISAF